MIFRSSNILNNYIITATLFLLLLMIILIINIFTAPTSRSDNYHYDINGDNGNNGIVIAIMLNNDY